MEKKFEGQREMNILRKQLHKDEVHIVHEDELPLTLKPKLDLVHSALKREKAKVNLEYKKITKHSKRASIQEGLSELERSKVGLIDSFVSADRGVQENRAATSRLREKIRDGKKQVVILESQVERMRDEILKYKAVKCEMEKYVDQYSVFEQFLKRVADTSDSFNSVGDVLNRFDTLENTRKEITGLVEKELKETNMIRKQMVSLVEEKANRFKELGNKLIQLQAANKEAKERRQYWEQKVGKLKRMTERNMEETVVLEGACGDLYRRVCKSRGHIPTIEDGNIEAQMQYFRKAIAYHKDVYSAAVAIRQLHQAGSYNRKLFLKNDLKVVGKARGKKFNKDLENGQ